VYDPLLTKGTSTINGREFAKWERKDSKITYSPLANGKSLYQHPDICSKLYLYNSMEYTVSDAVYGLDNEPTIRFEQKLVLTVEDRFHFGTEDYILVRVDPYMGPTDWENPLNRDRHVTKTQRLEQLQLAEACLYDTPIEPNSQYVEKISKEGKTTLYRNIKGKLAKTSVAVSGTWKLNDWYNYIVDDSKYTELVDIRAYNDATRKILQEKTLDCDTIKSIAYSLSVNNTKEFDMVNHILPLIQEAIKTNIETTIRMEGMLQSQAVQTLQKLKDGDHKGGFLKTINSKIFKKDVVVSAEDLENLFHKNKSTDLVATLLGPGVSIH